MKLHCKRKEAPLQPTEPDHYVTITGFQHYYGAQPFKIGQLIRCCKQPDNPYDADAICCSLPPIGTVGYLANSPQTVAGGTMSAGRIYDRIPRRFYVRVCFTSFTKIICKVVPGTLTELNREMQEQLAKNDRWDCE